MNLKVSTHFIYWFRSESNVSLMALSWRWLKPNFAALTGAKEIANSDIDILEKDALERLGFMAVRINKCAAEKSRRGCDAEGQFWTGKIRDTIVQFQPDVIGPGLAQTAATDAELTKAVAPIKDTRASG